MSAIMESGVATAIPATISRPGFIHETTQARLKWLWLGLGLLILLISLGIRGPAGMNPAALKTLAVIATSVLWWATEAVPVPITALMIPVVVHALGIMPFADAVSAGMGSTLVPFILGVLGLSAAFTVSGLGKRMTYGLLAIGGSRATRLIDTFLWLSFAISMFMDDLAVVAMLLPPALGILRTVQAKPLHSNFGKGLMMAIIFGSTLGGITTPAGVSANVITSGFLAQNANVHVSFLYWMAVATPIAGVITLVTQILIRSLFPSEMDHLPYDREAVQVELRRLGRMKMVEMTTASVGLVAVALWVTSDWTHIPMPVVSLLILAGITLPGFGVFRTWRDLTYHIEWGAVLLLAGGFVIGTAASRTGLAAWFVHQALNRFAGMPHFLQPGAAVLLTAIDSLGFASFGTTASVNVPFVIAYAQQNGLPVLTMGLAAAFASSIHFILVTQSPSITLPYSAGYFRVKDLAKIGILVTVVSAGIISLGITLADLLHG